MRRVKSEWISAVQPDPINRESQQSFQVPTGREAMVPFGEDESPGAEYKLVNTGKKWWHVPIIPTLGRPREEGCCYLHVSLSTCEAQGQPGLHSEILLSRKLSGGLADDGQVLLG